MKGIAQGKCAEMRIKMVLASEFNIDLMNILPDLSMIDRFLEDLIPGSRLQTKQLIENMLKGNWVLEPKIFLQYLKEIIENGLGECKHLFISILVLFILSAVLNSLMTAFHNNGMAKMTRLFLILCQFAVLLNAFSNVKDIVTDTMTSMLEFLKVAIPTYMMCVAATGSGLTAMIFYKLLLGMMCLVEGIVAAALIPVVEWYVMLGILEGICGEDRFRGLMELIKKTVQWISKGMIILLSGSGFLQILITPVIDKTNVTFMRKTVSAIPGIGDIAESVSNITIASAIAVKNSLGVVILLVLILIIMIPLIKVFLILTVIKLGGAIGSISGEKQMADCVDCTSDAGFLLLRILVTVTTLFFIAIAAITNATGGSIT